MKTFPFIWGLLLLTVSLGNCQEDSLRSALNAVDRRQRDLENPRYDEYVGDYGYFHDSPDDLAFLSDYNQESPQFFYDYIDENPYLNSNDIEKRTSFRERLEEDKEREIEELARRYIANSGIDPGEYNELVRELRKNHKNLPLMFVRPRIYANNNEIRKKSTYFPYYGIEGIRKRNKYDDDDYYNVYLNDDIYGSKSGWNKNKYDAYYPIEHIPVAKRSSSYAEFNKAKRSEKKKLTKTDPKVAKDLNNIFGMAPNEKHIEKRSNKSNTNHNDTKTITTLKPTSLPNNTKEKIIEGTLNDKPMQIKKKSINWSDYFGLDRRKKSDDLDNEWLMERYHKSITLASKKNADYPLQSFKNHDQPEKKTLNSNKKEGDGDIKMSSLDAKLKSMEDELIDDALKYTGAHEGTVDSREIQEVKDRVISRLAAAYNLEKMRRALVEYKMNIAKERERLKQQKQQKNSEMDYDMNEEKRASVARKHAIDEEREKNPETDNNIKCTQDDEMCNEQHYKTSSDVLEQTSNNFVECPRVQQACSDAAIGKYARIFEVACAMQQMCLICSNNSWFAPTRECNVLFLNKALELCAGKPDCFKEARRSVRALVDVNRALRMEPLGDCELACPDRR